MLTLNRDTSRWRKATAAAAGSALAAGVMVAVGTAAPAQAAEPAGRVLTWSVSDRFVDHFSPKPYAPDSAITATGGAVYTEGVATFAASGVAPAAGGATTYQYSGTLQGAFVVGGAEQYAVTISDPAITVAQDGSGEISAVASSREIGNVTSTPTRVTVAEFDESDRTGYTLTGTPNWEGVLAAGSPEAVQLGITNSAHPVDGKSFHPAFLGALTSGVRAHFYASGENQDVKAPDAFTARLSPQVTATVTKASADYIDVAVNGSDFDLTQNTQPSANGVYVGVAPTGTDIFAISSGGQADGMAKFVASDHVPASAVVDGSFTKALAVEVAKLTRGGSYTLFTWSAHGNPKADDALYTATPIAIDWATVPEPAAEKTKTKVKKVKANVKKNGVVVKVKVAAAGKGVKAKGKTRIVVKKGKQTLFKKTVKVNKKGVATLKINNKQLRKKLKGKSIKGTYKVNVKHLGNKKFAATKVDKSKFKIK